MQESGVFVHTLAASECGSREISQHGLKFTLLGPLGHPFRKVANKLCNEYKI